MSIVRPLAIGMKTSTGRCFGRGTQVMSGAPEAVIAELIHDARDVERGLKHLRQPLVRIAPLVGRRAVEADIVQLDLANIERVKAFDHGGVLPLLISERRSGFWIATP